MRLKTPTTNLRQLQPPFQMLLVSTSTPQSVRLFIFFEAAAAAAIPPLRVSTPSPPTPPALSTPRRFLPLIATPHPPTSILTWSCCRGLPSPAILFSILRVLLLLLPHASSCPRSCCLRGPSPSRVQPVARSTPFLPKPRLAVFAAATVVVLVHVFVFLFVSE